MFCVLRIRDNSGLRIEREISGDINNHATLVDYPVNSLELVLRCELPAV